MDQIGKQHVTSRNGFRLMVGAVAAALVGLAGATAVLAQDEGPDDTITTPADEDTVETPPASTTPVPPASTLPPASTTPVPPASTTPVPPASTTIAPPAAAP